MITHQASNPCHCGSMYRNGNQCNVCGVDTTEIDIKPDDKIKHTIQQKGRMWSKKLGRYLTQNEIKSGMKGN